MGRGSLDLASAVTATADDRPAVKRKERHGLVAGSASGFGVGEPAQLCEHGTVVIFVAGQPGFPWRPGRAGGATQPPREVGAESRPVGAAVHAGIHEGHLHVAGPAGHPAYVVVLVAVLVHVAVAASAVVGERRAVAASVDLTRGSGWAQDAPSA